MLDKLLVQLIQSPSYGDRKGAAFALAGVVKGVGIPWLTKGGVMKALEEAIQDRKSVHARQGSLFAIQVQCRRRSTICPVVSTVGLSQLFAL